MKPQLLDRLILPVMIPMGILVFIVVVLYCLSRILLALPEDAAPTVAIGVAIFIVLAASYVATQPISRPAVVLLVAVPSVLLVGGGVWGEIEYDGAEGEGEAVVENGGAGAVSVSVAMGDNFFDPKAFAFAAGADVTFRLTNNGAAIHNMRLAGPDGVYDTGDDAVSDPDLFRPGGKGTLSYRFETAGKISYRCDFHPVDMTGTIQISG